MSRKLFKTCWLFSIGLLTACSKTSESKCQSTVSENLQLSDSNPTSLGGYIEFKGVFGDKACNATFEVVEVLSEQIKIRAYSARHCRQEHGVVDWDDPATFPRTTLHLYLDRSAKRSAGYIKNIPANEEFSERAVLLAEQAQKMSMPKRMYEYLILPALKVPTHFYSDDAQIVQASVSDERTSTTPYDNDPLSQKTPNPELNICNDPRIPKFDANMRNVLTEACWSSLDVGQFDLEIRKKEMASNDFDYLAEQLDQKKKLLDRHLAKNPRLALMSQEQRRYFTQVRSELRMKNYAHLAYLLNFNHCAQTVAESEESVKLCKFQSQLIELVGKYLSEAGPDGNRVNIFDRLAREKEFQKSGITFAELRSGRRFADDPTLTTFDSIEEKADQYSIDLGVVAKYNVSSETRKMLERIKANSNDKKTDELSPEFVLSTNIQFEKEAKKTTPFFAQFQLTQISRAAGSVMIARNFSINDESILGITKEGTLRFGVRRGEERVKFSKTDSGSLITFSGVVPLMALNTVDDGEPVSGGASILALPEAQSEDVPPTGSVSAGESTLKGPSVDGKKKPMQVSATCL